MHDRGHPRADRDRHREDARPRGGRHRLDDVKAPTLADERASSDLENDFGLAGFRVPTILSSPYARQNYVDHRLYDHTSTLRFLEWRFLGGPPQGPGGGRPRDPPPRGRPAHNNPASPRGPPPPPP